MRRACLTFTFILMLSGCSNDTPEAMVSDYMWRVSNVLDTDIDTELDDLPPLTPFPLRRERLLPIVDVRQGLLEVLDLEFCDILPLIAERNSSLGKVMLPSKQLAYELRFFTAIRACRLKASDDLTPSLDPELRQRINAIYQTKLNNLHNVVWNGIYTAREFELQFTTTAAPLPLQGDTGYPAVGRSLDNLNQLATVINSPTTWQPAAVITAIEQDYATLNSNPFGGQAMRSVQLLSVAMERTAEAINRRIARAPLCFPGHKTSTATTLGNVFNKFYAGRFQPYLAKVDRDTKQWLQAQQALFEQFEPPEGMSAYMQQLHLGQNSLWQRYNRARKAHIAAWQELLTQCGMMPSSRNRPTETG